MELSLSADSAGRSVPVSADTRSSRFMVMIGAVAPPYSQGAPPLDPHSQGRPAEGPGPTVSSQA